MSDFKKMLCKLMDDGAVQAKSFFDEMDKTLSSIDWDSHLEYINEKRKYLMDKGNELFKDLGDFLRQVNDDIKDYEVKIPFDKQGGETFSYTVDGGTLKVEVAYQDEFTTRKNSTTITPPSNCDLTALSYEVNEGEKIVTFFIPKKLNEAKEEKVEEATQPTEVEETQGPKEEATPTPSEEPKPKKLARRIAANAARIKYFQDGGGRFVRKDPNVN